MKKTMQMVSVAAVVMAMAFAASACNFNASTGYVKGDLLENSDTMVVMSVVEEEGNMYVIDLMKDLQKAGKITYELSADGFIESINGKANAADFSSCWMLYTSEDDLSSEEYGYIEYKGEKLYGALFGASQMPLDDGELYVWSYVSF